MVARKLTPMLEKQIDELKKAIESQRLAFLVGAGISMEPPSYLTTWPQSDCMRVLTTGDPDADEKMVRALRPEVFFQVLYNTIGMKTLKALEVLNPATLNSDEEIVAPNLLHFFLAEMMRKGHVVLTSNFDDLIERAFAKLTDGKSEPRVVVSDLDIQSLCGETDSESGCLIKIHGSFLTPGGKNSQDSIVALLQQVQREFPESKRELMRKIVAGYDLVVLGYSGRDDFDLYPYLLEPPPGRRIWWINHVNEKNSENEKNSKNGRCS